MARRREADYMRRVGMVMNSTRYEDTTRPTWRNVSTRRGRQQPIPFPIGRYNWSPHVRVNPLHQFVATFAGVHSEHDYTHKKPQGTAAQRYTVPVFSCLLNLKYLKQPNKPLCVPRSSLLCWLAGQPWTMSCRLALARPTRRNCFSVCGLPCVL